MPPILARLSWWREELTKLAQGVPQHPASLQFHTTLAGQTLTVAPWQQLLQGIQEQYTGEPPATESHWWERACQAGGGIEVQVAKWQGITEPTALAAAVQLGGAEYAWVRLTQLRQLIRVGCCPLPQDGLRREQLSAARLSAEPQRGAGLLQALVQQLIQQLHTAAPQLAPLDQRIRAALLLSLLREIEPDAALLLTHQVTLTPLRQCWIALHCASTSWARKRGLKQLP